MELPVGERADHAAGEIEVADGERCRVPVAVCHEHATAGPDDPGGLAQHGDRVDDVLENLDDAGGIEGTVGEGQRPGVTLDDGDLDALNPGLTLRGGEHRRRRVDGGDPGTSDGEGRGEDTGTGADVDDALARLRVEEVYLAGADRGQISRQIGPGHALRGRARVPARPSPSRCDAPGHCHQPSAQRNPPINTPPGNDHRGGRNETGPDGLDSADDGGTEDHPQRAWVAFVGATIVTGARSRATSKVA